LPQREPAHARGPAGIPAGAGRGAHARIRRGRDARGSLRADDSRAPRRRREAFLHQQSSDRPRPARAGGRARSGRSDGMTAWVGRAGWAGAALLSTAVLGAQQPPARQTALQRLQSAIERTTKSVNATWGIYVKSLESGEEIAIDA